ncbi:hypothetical protein KAU11_03560 [Candidatus Babeliales bacterium]|nr:hypothetical protein [Candidatus Babeliales bacterium]
MDVQGNAQEEVVAQVKKADNPLATPTPGTFVPYWISVDDGLILVGASTTPGENIFMAWRDPNPRSDVSRIGFGTHDAFVEYTGIEVRDPVTLQKPEKVYAKATSGVSVSSPDPKWLSTPFRVPGRGTFEFEVSGDKDAMIYLSEKKSAKNKHYQLVLSADETGNAVLRKWDERSKMYIDLVKTSTQYREKNQLNTKEYKKFWISLAKGRIFIGRGEIGQGLFLYHWDMKPLEKILNLGVACSGGTTSFRNVVIAPPVDVSVAEKREAYVQEQDRFKFRGSLHVISPYEYVLSQEGQAVKFEDKINHKTYYPGKTPQQDAKYYFMLMLHKDGFPELVWAREPENPQKLSIEKRASILRAESDTWFQASTWVQGMGVLGGLAGVAASIRYAEKGIDLGKEAGVKETAANLNFRSHDSYVYTDQAVAQQLAQAHVPEEARANKMKAEEKIELGGKWSPSTIDKLERLIPLYQQVINLVNHPFVVRDQYIKKSLFDAISTMYESHQDIHAHPQAPVDLTYSGMINLLVSAYNNPYLIDLNKKKEMKLKEVWYSQINELARQMLQKDPETKVSLQPCYGEYVWLNDQFEEPGKGSVSFEAKGTNDIFVAFASMPTRVRNTDNEIYETVLGGWDNEKAVIRVRSLDKSVSESFDKKLNVNQIKYQRYWVSVKDGQMNLGTGDLDIKNIIFSWKDPYPIKDVQFVGISNWNAAGKFKNVQIGPAVEDVEEHKAKIIAQIMELRQKQAQASVIESEEDLTETPVEPYDEEATEYAGEVEPEVITDQVEEMAPVEDEEELSMAEIVESEKTVEEEIEQLIEPAVEPFVEEDTVVDQEAAIKEETTAVKEEPVVKYRTVRRGRYTYQEPIK